MYREARRAAFGQSVARLQQASSAAVSTLLKIMVEQNSPASTRVRAADSVLNHGIKAIEIEDIEVRVAALETAAWLKVEGRWRSMKLGSRLQRLEAKAPKIRKRVIVIWIDGEGRRTKAADTGPEFPDLNQYHAYLAPYASQLLQPAVATQ